MLAQAGFDEFVEKLCAPYYKDGGRPGIPPGTYFRLLFIGYFEGLDSQRGIAWRCADSLALRGFLGLGLTEATPAHASMSVIRQRLPADVFDQVFHFVLGLLDQKGLLKGRTLGIDATTLEANAAMKSIVRKDTGADWKTYLRTLAKAEGLENPTDADLQRLDRGRTDKKVSNEHWESPADPDARIARMKDGTTHLAYKAEHAVDLQTEVIVAASVTSADRGDGASGAETLIVAQWNLHQSGSAAAVTQLVADKGYHDNRLDSGARGATTTFVERGIGDVLINWENEILLGAKEFGPDKFELVVPSVSILCEPTVCLVDKNAKKHGTEEVAKAYLNYLYSPEGQEIAAKHYFRPRNQEVLAKYARQFPDVKLFTLAEISGDWQKTQKTHFSDGGIFDRVYKP